MSIRRPVRCASCGPSALTTPAVTEHSNPKGLPTACELTDPQRPRATSTRAGSSIGARYQRCVRVRVFAERALPRSACPPSFRPEPGASVTTLAVGQDQAIGRERKPDRNRGGDLPPCESRLTDGLLAPRARDDLRVGIRAPSSSASRRSSVIRRVPAADRDHDRSAREVTSSLSNTAASGISRCSAKVVELPGDRLV